MSKLIKIIAILLLSVSTSFAQKLLLFDKASEFSPSDRADLALWFKGDAELTSATWGDQSANNADMVLTNSPDISNTLNGMPTVLFDGTIPEYGKTNEITLSQPVTIYAVLKIVNNIADRYVWDGYLNNYCGIRGNGSNPIGALKGYSGSELITENFDTGDWIIITYIYNSTSSMSIICPGTETTNTPVTTTGNTGTNPMNGLTLNARGGDFGLPANIQIAEIVIFNNADTEDEQIQIQNYLNNKWNVYPSN